ncbi:MAG: hypothetical protein MR654_08000 [Corynebacterium glucuronolyticum]|nr:hypothetical protein [Corynebacterium glucuronolyticum]
MNTTKTQSIKQIASEYKILGHTMSFGEWIIATNRIWNDQQGGYEHFATLYKRTDATHAIKMSETDEAFSDEGHATAWALSMAAEYDASHAE